VATLRQRARAAVVDDAAGQTTRAGPEQESGRSESREEVEEMEMEVVRIVTRRLIPGEM
jgi:hypothetical protein